jgi:tRNA splicing ligase
MKLSEYLNVEKLNSYLEKGLVTVRKHSTLPLSIYCYGRKAVYGNVWDDITTKTRGLIVADDGEIVARPYEKFFAYQTDGRPETYGRNLEVSEKLFGTPVITEKINGCLGIFWKYGAHWGVASKGSFNSPHAQFATKWLEEHVETFGTLVFPEGYTPVFEIICQEVQPHVIKYPKDGLVLLSLVNIRTGEELKQETLQDYAIKNKLAHPTWWPDESLTFKDALKDDDFEFEGYVASFNRPGQTPIKIKIKFPTFLKNRKLFYEEQKLKERKSVNDTQYQDVFNKSSALLLEALSRYTTRAEYAEFFNQPENKMYSSVCFAMLDEHDHKGIINRMIGVE